MCKEMKGDVGVGECGGGDGEFDKARWVGGEERKQCEEGEGEGGAVRCINKRAKAFEKKSTATSTEETKQSFQEERALDVDDADMGQGP